MPDGSATAHLYQPKLLTVAAEGYSLDHFRKDLTAALTVAIVALPLSMAFAIASGVTPERGLYTAIIGGFLVSALSGSRYQIGGPAGAFILLVSATGTRFGLQGLFLTVLMSGVLLTLAGPLPAGLADPPYPSCRDGGLHRRHRHRDPVQPAARPRRRAAHRRRAGTAAGPS